MQVTGERLANNNESKQSSCLTVNALVAISNIIQKHLPEDSYPTSAPWTEKEKWAGIVRRRSPLIQEANCEILRYLKPEEGENSETVLSLEILAEIAPELNEIAACQLESVKKERMSWRDFSPENAASLNDKIVVILENPHYQPYLEVHAGIRNTLVFIKDTLIDCSDPIAIAMGHADVLEACISDNKNRKTTFFISFETDFTDPVEDGHRLPRFCEASVSLITPLSENDYLKVQNIAQETVNAFKKQDPDNENVKLAQEAPIIAGNAISFAGMEVLSQTSGQSFSIYRKDRKIKGIYIAPNILAKNSDYWKITDEIFANNNSDNSFNPLELALILYIMHELGHICYPKYGILGEAATDIPVAMTCLSLAQTIDSSLSPTMVIKGLISEYISQIIDNKPKSEDPRRAAKQNKTLSSSYFLSGSIIINSLIDSGLVFSNGSSFDINPDDQKMQKFINYLTSIHRQLNQSRIRYSTLIGTLPNASSLKLADLYSQRMNK